MFWKLATTICLGLCLVAPLSVGLGLLLAVMTFWFADAYLENLMDEIEEDEE
jgi:hypothetical protein